MDKITAMPRRAANKLRVRNALLQAAINGFAENGVRQTTMDEIAERANLSRATLFKYFPSRGDILTAITQIMDDRLTELIETYATSDLSVADRVVAMFRTSSREMERRPELRRIIGISEQSRGEGMNAQRFSRLKHSFLKLVYDVPQPERRTLSDVLTGTYIGIVHNWRFETKFPLEQRLVEAAELIIRSIHLDPEKNPCTWNNNRKQ